MNRKNKCKELLDDNYVNRMKNYFNPYEYNLSNWEELRNEDLKNCRTQSHFTRNLKKNNGNT